MKCVCEDSFCTLEFWKPPRIGICKSLQVCPASNEHRNIVIPNPSTWSVVHAVRSLALCPIHNFSKLLMPRHSGNSAKRLPREAFKVVRGIPWLNSKNCQEYKKTRKRLKDLQIFTYLHITSYYIIAINWKKIGLLKTCQCNESEWKDPHENLIEFVHMQSPAFPRNI